MSDLISTPCRAPLSRWGRSPQHASAHAAAARLQARYPHLIIWFGETSGHYYVLDTNGLHAHPSIDAATVFAWWHTHRPHSRVEVAR